MSAVPVEPSTCTAFDHIRALQHPLHRRGVRAAEASAKQEQWHPIPEPMKCLASSRRSPCFDMLKFRYEVTLTVA
jgi:hypothetical protein